MTQSYFERGRARMVEQLRVRGIENEAIIGAFEAVPREAFVPSGVTRRLAYLPVPLPIGHGQTLSQPYIVARMLALAEITREQTVLDVGSGSGYQTALLARLCRRVHAVEIVPELVTHASKVLRGLHVDNVSFHVADGNDGLPEHGPYDAIVVAATAPNVPERLIEQLKEGGRLIIPVGRQMSKFAMALHMMRRTPSPQQLYRIVRMPGGVRRERLEDVYFVPFVGG